MNEHKVNSSINKWSLIRFSENSPVDPHSQKAGENEIDLQAIFLGALLCIDIGHNLTVQEESELQFWGSYKWLAGKKKKGRPAVGCASVGGVVWKKACGKSRQSLVQ